MGMGTVVQHNDIPSEHAGMFTLGGSTKVLEGSTIALCTDGDVRGSLHTSALAHSFGSDEDVKAVVVQ
jgi:hypothetical protein